jgi:hypothetical protein
MNERALREEISGMTRQLSLEEILDLLCVPKAADDPQDIEFDEYSDADEAAERDFIERWLEEERDYKENIERARTEETEVKQHVV